MHHQRPSSFQPILGSRDVASRLPAARIFSAVISSCIDSHSSPRWSLGLRCFEEMKSMGFYPTDDAYNDVLWCYETMGNLAASERCLEEMQALGVPLRVYTRLAFVKRLARNGDVEAAEASWMELVEEEAGMVGQNAERRRRDGGSRVPMYQSLLGGTSVMALHARNGDPGSAERVFRVMMEKGVPVDGVAFTTMIAAVARVGDYVAADTWREMMRQAGKREDVKTFHAVMNAHMRGRDIHGVYENFEVLLKSGRIDRGKGSGPRKGPNTHVFNVMLRAAIFSRRDLRPILEAMESRGLSADAYTYSALLEATRVTGDVDAATTLFVEITRLSHIARAAGRSALHSDASYKHFLMTLMAAPAPDHAVEEVLNAMQEFRDDVVPDGRTWLALITVVNQKGQTLGSAVEAWARLKMGLERDDGSGLIARVRYNRFLQQVVAPVFATVVREGKPSGAHNPHATDVLDIAKLLRREIASGMPIDASSWEMFLDGMRATGRTLEGCTAIVGGLKELIDRIERLRQMVTRVGLSWNEQEDTRLLVELGDTLVERFVQDINESQGTAEEKLEQLVSLKTVLCRLRALRPRAVGGKAACWVERSIRAQGTTGSS